ncbi:MAG: archaellin/type IV pilin N-terminal domain-containing protein [Asgard group archaeon]|nr:archaellin/type IV pilin N-terminal domain-containing protein [Asgard group archaeon]
MLNLLKKIYRKRKAISPVVSALLLIALTVSTVSIVYFLIIPYFNTAKLTASVTKIQDTDRDSRYDKMELFVANTGTSSIEITNIIVWTAPQGLISDENYWTAHRDWDFIRSSDSVFAPSKMKEVYLSGEDQIELTISEDTYYRLEIYYSGQEQPYYSEWDLLNDQADFSDLISDFKKFDLQANGFEGTIDVPGCPSNNYNTTGGPLFGPLLKGQYIYLPVINQSQYVPFYITGKIVIFHANEGNLTEQPKFQQLDRSSQPFKARFLFLLGLAGSWGDEFPTNGVALTLNVTYTDGSSSFWELGHDYIDNWWYNSNSPNGCTSAPYGKITEIDLGTQLDYSTQPIHTHTACFNLNFYKYIQYITFVDPGTDRSGPHLLSLTCG